jgi:hypothetical protein
MPGPSDATTEISLAAQAASRGTLHCGEFESVGWGEKVQREQLVAQAVPMKALVRVMQHSRRVDSVCQEGPLSRVLSILTFHCFLFVWVVWCCPSPFCDECRSAPEACATRITENHCEDACCGDRRTPDSLVWARTRYSLYWAGTAIRPNYCESLRDAEWNPTHHVSRRMCPNADGCD